MKAGRFLKLAQSRAKLKFILNNLNAGNIIMLSTYTRHVQYDKRHLDFFKVTKSGDLLVRRGKNWDDMTYNVGIKAYKKEIK